MIDAFNDIGGHHGRTGTIEFNGLRRRKVIPG